MLGLFPSLTRHGARNYLLGEALAKRSLTLPKKNQTHYSKNLSAVQMPNKHYGKLRATKIQGWMRSWVITFILAPLYAYFTEYEKYLSKRKQEIFNRPSVIVIWEKDVGKYIFTNNIDRSIFFLILLLI